MKRLAAVVLVGSLLWLGGCSKQSPSAPATSQPGWFARMAASVRARFADGNAELQRAFEAKKNARSWRMKTVLASHPGYDMVTVTEVSCPDRERMVTNLGNISYTAVRVGNDGYIQGGGQPWAKGPITSDYYPCGANPGQPAPWAMMNEGRDMTTALAMLAKNATVTRGQLLQVNGDTCQDWVVAMGHPGGGNRTISYNLCIGADHLPRQVALGKGTMTVTYYDWNAPIQIDAPSVESVETPGPSRSH